MTTMEAEVMFAYEKTQDDELDLKVGEIIKNVKMVDEGWCEGEVRGLRGMFPDNFVKLREAPVEKPIEKPVEKPPVRETGAAIKTKRAKVAFSYVADNPDELTLEPGQTVEIIKEIEDGWYSGRLNGKEGVFPSNFLDHATMTESPTPEPATGEPPLAAATSKPHVMGGHKLFPSLDPTKVRAGLKPVIEKKPAAPPPVATPASKPPPAKPEPKREQAKVVFEYKSGSPDELSIEPGDILEILDKDIGQDGWWKASLKGKIGLIPDNFVEVITVAEPKSHPTKPKAAPPPENKPPPKEAPAKPLGPRNSSISSRPPPPAAEPKPPVTVKEETIDTTDNQDFGVPHTDPLDNSAVKDRPKKASRPPSRSNLRMDETNNLDDPKPPPASTPAAAPGGGGVGLSPWQAELQKRKKAPPPAPGSKPAAPQKKPITKPAPAKPPSTVTTRPKPPPVEPSPQPPRDIPSPHNPPTPTPPQSTTPVHAPPSDDSWKEAYDGLKAEFEQFKKFVKEQLLTYTEDLDEERKSIRGLQIDVDRLKKLSALKK